jgi:pyochelin biosynthetic protein PchC
MLPVIRSDYRAVEMYEPTPGSRVTTPIYAHIGADDARVSVDEAESWRSHTSGEFTLQTHPGGHFYLAEKNQTLIRMIKGVLSG